MSRKPQEDHFEHEISWSSSFPSLFAGRRTKRTRYPKDISGNGVFQCRWVHFGARCESHILLVFFFFFGKDSAVRSHEVGISLPRRPIAPPPPEPRNINPITPLRYCTHQASNASSFASPTRNARETANVVHGPR